VSCGGRRSRLWDGSGRTPSVLRFAARIVRSSVGATGREIATRCGGGGSGDVTIVVTNQGMTSNEWASASLAEIAKYGVTNAYQGLTGQIAGVVSSWHDGMGAGSTFQAPTVPDAGEMVASIPIAAGFTFDINTGNLPNKSEFATAKSIARWVIIMLNIYMMFKWGEGALLRLANQNQIKGNNQSFFGVNLSMATAVTYVSIVSAVVASLPVALGTYIANHHGGSIAFPSVSGNGWNMATYIFPADTAIYCFITYCVYRWVVGTPLLLAVCMLLLMLIA